MAPRYSLLYSLAYPYYWRIIMDGENVHALAPPPLCSGWHSHLGLSVEVLH
jgi:hypothetical protein